MKIKGKLGANETAVEVEIENGSISRIDPVDEANVDLRLAPGFIDIQINGYDGIDFNDAETTTELIAETAQRLRRTGVTAFCPTVITGSQPHITKCLSNLISAAEQSSGFRQAALGVHLEGPFISPEDGPRGAHPKPDVCPPDWDKFQFWQDVAYGQIRILTLSPEWPESLKFIERAVKSGIIVAIGHTAATPAQIVDAVRAGARLSTHLGNGSHAKIDRHPNYIWEQLAADELWASLIVDGHHLPPSVVKSFLRCKSIARSILVTDAIAAAGLPAGQYKLGNVAVEVTPQRKVCLPGTPYLAGSVLEMHEAIGKTVEYSDATLDDAIRMATNNPAMLLGVEDQYGSIEVGRRADLVLFKWDELDQRIEVVKTVINGR